MNIGSVENPEERNADCISNFTGMPLWKKISVSLCTSGSCVRYKYSVETLSTSRSRLPPCASYARDTRVLKGCDLVCQVQSRSDAVSHDRTTVTNRTIYKYYQGHIWFTAGMWISGSVRRPKRIPMGKRHLGLTETSKAENSSVLLPLSMRNKYIYWHTHLIWYQCLQR